MNYAKTEEFFNKENIEYITNESLTNLTTFKTGGKADIVCYPDNETKASKLIKYLNDNNLKYFVLGNGSNVLALDSGYDGIIVSTDKLDTLEYLNDGIMICGSGLQLVKACRFALEESLSGLEFAFGIPGTIGGAAFMNAGAYGGEMKDVVISVNYIDNNGNIGKFMQDKLNMSYRNSIFTSGKYFITSVEIKLNKGNKDEIKAKMDELIGKRKDKQPLEFPSAGSTFKRPEGYFAGALIEECGLKGYTCGSACVSEKHAGFVINKGNATSEDVLSVIEHCQKTVLDVKGVLLETEVRIIQ